MTTDKISVVRETALDIMKEVNLPWCVTQHGREHVKRVAIYLEQLLNIFRLEESEMFVLRAATWLHDIGQSNFAVDEWDSRENHHIYSREMVAALCNKGKLPLRKFEEDSVSELVFRHNLETELPRGELRFLTVLLRTADVMDITKRRAISNDAGVQWYEVRGRLERELPDRLVQWNHWAGHLAIDEIELKLDQGKLCFELFVNNPQTATFQIERFEKKISGIREYADCDVRVYCSEEEPESRTLIAA